MKKSIVAASTLALALMGGVMSTPARADSGDIYFEMIFAMADKNKDTMVTRAQRVSVLQRTSRAGSAPRVARRASFLRTRSPASRKPVLTPRL